MSKLRAFDIAKYHTFAELKEILQRIAEDAPALCKLETLGHSWQGREVFGLTITDFATGNPDEKPGFYADACTHAEEFCGCNVLLYMVRYLIEGFGTDASVTRLLKDNVLYVIPRLNPDGIEFAMEGNPWCGNGRYLPGETQPLPGFYWEDLNGDGVIAQMRKEDPDGEWKISEKDSRIMVLRKPYETEGTFYRLYPEGKIRGEVIGAPLPKPRDGNINRNYPGLWTPDGMQYGAGELPMDEPETKAVCEYILKHKNIAGIMSFHTNAGVILRPFVHQSDKHFKGRDKEMFCQLGAMGTEELGYPVVSVFEEFTPEAEGVRGGTLTDWTYFMKGIPGIVTELWNVYAESGCGITDPYPPEYLGEEADLKMLAWAEAHLGDRAYVDWQAYDHPQLGKVELGGWNRIRVFRNPPEDYLEDLCHKAAMFTVKLAQTLPRLRIYDAKVEHMAGDVYKVSAVVRNSGYLPTYLSAQAAAVNCVAPLALELAAVEGEISVECATDAGELPQLEGRFGRDCEWSQWIYPWKATEKKVEWVIRSAAPPKLRITVGNDRCGIVRQEISFEA